MCHRLSPLPDCGSELAPSLMQVFMTLSAGTLGEGWGEGKPLILADQH